MYVYVYIYFILFITDFNFNLSDDGLFIFRNVTSKFVTMILRTMLSLLFIIKLRFKPTNNVRLDVCVCVYIYIYNTQYITYKKIVKLGLTESTKAVVESDHDHACRGQLFPRVEAASVAEIRATVDKDHHWQVSPGWGL